MMCGRGRQTVVAVGPVLAVAAVMLAIALVGGPFVAYFIGLGAVFLIIPALVWFGVLAIWARAFFSQPVMTSVMIVIGWSVAYVVASGAAWLMNVIPDSAALEVAPHLVWALILWPFAALGVVISLGWFHISRWRGGPHRRE